MVMILDGVERLVAALGVEEDEDGIDIMTASWPVIAWLVAAHGLRLFKQLGEWHPA